jgi:hypothetical protein
MYIKTNHTDHLIDFASTAWVITFFLVAISAAFIKNALSAFLMRLYEIFVQQNIFKL